MSYFQHVIQRTALQCIYKKQDVNDSDTLLKHRTLCNFMKGNEGDIRKIRSIVDVERIRLTHEIKERLGSEWSKSAQNNNKHIFVYKIFYKSKKKKVAGYIIEPRKGKNLPCIIWNRGGAREFGSIKLGNLFSDLATIAPFAMRGFVVIATQYPGVAGGEGMDKKGGEDDLASILDLQNILKEYKRTDDSRIGMFGFSRGGLMTYMCLSKVKWIRAAVICSAPTDELSARNFRKERRASQKRLYGGSVEETINVRHCIGQTRFPRRPQS